MIEEASKTEEEADPMETEEAIRAGVMMDHPKETSETDPEDVSTAEKKDTLLKIVLSVIFSLIQPENPENSTTTEKEVLKENLTKEEEMTGEEATIETEEMTDMAARGEVMEIVKEDIKVVSTMIENPVTMTAMVDEEETESMMIVEEIVIGEEAMTEREETAQEVTAAEAEATTRGVVLPRAQAHPADD